MLIGKHLTVLIANYLPILPAPAKHLCWPVPSDRQALRNAVQEKKTKFCLKDKSSKWPPDVNFQFFCGRKTLKHKVRNHSNFTITFSAIWRSAGNFEGFTEIRNGRH